MITDSIDIPVYKINYLREKINKLNRKAKKLGCPAMVLTFDNEYQIEYNHDPYTGKKLLTPYMLDMVTANLIYEIPNINGYELIATLDIYRANDGHTEVVVNAVPEKEIPEKYKHAKTIQCDHCGHNRYRNHSILIQNIESGEYKEVGSTCVKDFFQGNDPSNFMWMASIKFHSIIDSISDESMSYGRYEWKYGISEVLTISAAAIAKWGYISKNRAYEDDTIISTAIRVSVNLNPDPKMEESRKVQVVQEDKDLAEKTIEYFKTLDPGNNDYLINCCKIVSLGYVPEKMIGYASSMIVAYKKAMDLIVKNEKIAKEGQSSNWIGEIGERLRNIEIKVTYTREFITDFGTNVLYIFKDANGNIYKTFYSGSTWKCEVDEMVKITGTVKKHDEYNGIKQTMLNRVSVS